jgi:hypothetical protein
MIRTFILTLTLLGSLSCLADSDEHFLRKPGSIAFGDATNQVDITATEGDASRLSVSVKWRSGDGAKFSVTQVGWFVFIESASRVWVFDGDHLSLLHFHAKSLWCESKPEITKTCPEQVRDVLPESFRKKYFP